LNADPCGSGSETLIISFKSFLQPNDFPVTGKAQEKTFLELRVFGMNAFGRAEGV
jgi:hypothetical protein